MTDNLLRLTDADLLGLAKALRSKRLDAPYTPLGVQRVASSPLASEIAAELQGLADQGFTAFQIATTLELIVKAAQSTPPRRGSH